MKTKLWAVLLVILCTALTSLGQLFFKFGADKLVFSFMPLVTNVPLITGILLYGAGAILLIIALKGGELSVLYPLVSLGFIWVSFLSAEFLGEAMVPIKWAGVIAIIIGVSFIGWGSKGK